MLKSDGDLLALAFTAIDQIAAEGGTAAAATFNDKMIAYLTVVTYCQYIFHRRRSTIPCDYITHYTDVYVCMVLVLIASLSLSCYVYCIWR
jgi:hypothetical protein